MTTPLTDRLARLGAAAEPVLAGGLRGLEKESLRVAPDGRLSNRPHPRALGSALVHPHITTDYSEALIELVTPAAPSNAEVLDFLDTLHRFIYARLDGERLWPVSMPCRLAGDDSVPIAEYGSSNVGRMKHVYRRGLGHRYGRVMQTISGVHFNYSLPERFWPVYAELEGHGGSTADFVSDAYMGLVRNFRRVGWIVLYLFGASPAVCPSFFAGRSHWLESLEDGTLYMPYATSLRMSDLGYQNKTQSSLVVSANSLSEYIEGLTRAIRTPHPDYEDIGVKVDGAYRQLSANLLQIENEYYSLIRPKRVARSGERPTQALDRGGVEYVEVRALDVDPFEPVGVAAGTLAFLECLLIACLLDPAPPMDAEEQAEMDANQRRVAREGRRPGLELSRCGRPYPLADWAHEILDGVAAVARVLDSALPGGYVAAVETVRAAVDRPELTPSARILAALAERRASFFEFACERAEAHAAHFAAPPAPAADAYLAAESARSLAAQAEIEAADTHSFDDYLAAYFADV
jgi:glutamate--cysteine ligase